MSISVLVKDERFADWVFIKALESGISNIPNEFWQFTSASGETIEMEKKLKLYSEWSDAELILPAIIVGSVFKRMVPTGVGFVNFADSTDYTEGALLWNEGVTNFVIVHFSFYALKHLRSVLSTIIMSTNFIKILDTYGLSYIRTVNYNSPVSRGEFNTMKYYATILSIDFRSEWAIGESLTEPSIIGDIVSMTESYREVIIGEEGEGEEGEGEEGGGEEG